MPPQVTVILPTYNRANLLEQCVRSIIAQSFTDWELIISDDASTDATAVLAQDMKDRDHRILYRCNPTRLGLPKNRNQALREARASLVFFVEDDLLLDKEALTNLVSAYRRLVEEGHRVGAVAPRLLTEYEKPRGPLNDWEKAVNQRSNAPCIFYGSTGLIIDNFGIDTGETREIPKVHACSLYPAQVSTEIGGYAESRYRGNYSYEDVDFSFRIAARGYRLFFEPTAVVHHLPSSTGGCRLDGQAYAPSYYFLRNHIVFLGVYSGLGALYKVPLFLGFLNFKLLEYTAKRGVEMARRGYRSKG